MSKIGDAVIEAQERTGKTVGELEPEDLKVDHPAAKARKFMNDDDMDVDQAVLLGWTIFDLENSTNALNAFRGDLRPVKADIELVIAKLTKLSEKIK